MDAKEFALLVSEDVKNKADQKTKDFLRLKENWEEWRDCLITIIEAVSEKINVLSAEADQLRTTYSDFVTDPASSIVAQIEKSQRFRFHAEKRLAEVDRLIKLDGETDVNVSLAAFLREAITTHRDKKVSSGAVDIYDQMLWDSIDGKWGF